MKKMTQEVSQNPNGAGGQAVPETVSISLGFGTYTHRFEYSLLYSIKKMNFVRGNAHKGLSWSVDYRLFPGRYVLLETWGYLDRRGAIVKASLVYINKKGRIKYLESVSAEYIVPARSDNAALQAFFDALPGYHGLLEIPRLEAQGPGWEEIKESIKKLNNLPTDPEA
ncbi:MAG: hypothetical protein QXP36_12335 [Conexivisphaerales archaeon]